MKTMVKKTIIIQLKRNLQISADGKTATNVTELHNHTVKDKIYFLSLVVIIPETSLSYLIQVARDKCF